MGGSEYKGAVTILPDGRVYTGQHENGAPEGQKLYAKIQKQTKKENETIGLAAKVKPMQGRTGALFARIVNEGLSLAATTTIAQSENITHLQLVRCATKSCSSSNF